MTSAPPAAGAPRVRRRELQKEQTRLVLALAAFDLAREHGLANVRIPQIAAAVGVSPRTFNNYFPSKEAAIVWPSTVRGARMAADLADRPAGEPLADADADLAVRRDNTMATPIAAMAMPAAHTQNRRTLVTSPLVTTVTLVGPGYFCLAH